MPRKGKRKRLATGIYEDGTGRSIKFRDIEKRFPPFTSVKILRDELDKLKRKHRGSGRISKKRGTLNEAVNRWAQLERHLSSWRERRSELRAWCELHGDHQFHSIADEDVRTAIGIWTDAGVAAKTIRNRLWTLGHLYKVLEGKDAETPVDEVDPPPKVRHVVTPVSPETILKVYAKLLAFEASGRLPDAKTRARFMVRASTGKRPSEIMRAVPDDVDLSRRIWLVRDGKGGWSEGLFLNDDMIVAWQTFADANAWGDFNTGSQAEVLRAAGWPSERHPETERYLSRPYHLRHSIGLTLSEGGHDLADIGPFLGHKDLRTTRETYVPVLGGRMQRLSESLSGRLNGWNVPQSVPRSDLEEPAKPLEHLAISESSQKAKKADKRQKTQ